MSKLKLVIIAFLGIAIINACEKDDDGPPKGNLNLSISGLEDLGRDYVYEGWLIVDGTPYSAGIFAVDGSGKLSQTSFEINAYDADNATAYILTIEPSPDTDPNPSAVHLLAGDFSDNSASLSVGHGSALGNDFSTSTGTYILATPTNGDASDENSGVWWVDPTGPRGGLSLPTLPAGWKYEGWAVINGTPVTTGKFLSATAADESAPYSGDLPGPAFPGEDFLRNAPSELTFPTDLAGTTVVISVEPEPDNSVAPFLLKPLVAGVPSAATDHTPYEMSNNSSGSNPSGTVSKQR